MFAVCITLNAPVKPSKVEGPTTYLTFLGIIIHTTLMTVGISDEQKQDIIISLQFLLQKSLQYVRIELDPQKHLITQDGISGMELLKYLKFGTFVATTL